MGPELSCHAVSMEAWQKWSSFVAMLEFFARAQHLLTAVREEFFCSARDLDTMPHLGAPEAQEFMDLLARAGGNESTARKPLVRKLVSPAALASQHGLDRLHEVTAGGTEVRVTPNRFRHKTMIIDRRVVVVAGPDAPGGRDYTVTTEPALVAAVFTLFEVAWDTANDFTTFIPGVLDLDDAGRMILRALSSGVTDETAARGLAMSLRTYRRRVAELLAALDADSRFQAGLRAGELGLTR